MTRTDTICALSSGALPAAIALIRLSGPRTRQLANRHLATQCPAPRRATLTRLVDQTGAAIDEAIAVFFEGPASYTGEDMLELSLHGGSAIVGAAIETLTAQSGVRLAEPGEFTRRALEAGKLDLSEAEAVADLVEAETRAQREQALRQLDGEISGAVTHWRGTLIDVLALIEVAVDFPDEEDAPDFTHDAALSLLQPLIASLEEQLGDEQIGEQVRDGFRIALIGPPNAGKSSLFNHLAGREAAIVTDIPGTTRDVIEVRMDLGGHLVRVFDTAGLRDTADPIEREGVRRAGEAARKADLTLLVLDGSVALDADSQHLQDATELADIVILNKADLGCAIVPESVSRETQMVSARTGLGLDQMSARLAALISDRVAASPSPIITRARHRQAVEAAHESLSSAALGLESGAPAELVAEDVRLGIRHLDALVGRIDVEDVLGAVFSRFCIGK